jgi:ArsR family transcriptional regulator
VEVEQIQRIARALADPRRREILEMIATAEEQPALHCGAIVERLPISQPTVSHHIKELQAAGLIEIHPDGQFNRLTLCTTTMNEYIESLRASLHLPSSEKS